MKTLILVFIFFSNISIAQDSEVIVKYMESDEPSQKLLSDVLKIKNIEEIMVYFLFNGPMPARLENYKFYLKANYKKLKEFVKKYPKNKISNSEKKYVLIYISNFQASYRTRAAFALAKIKTPEAKQALLEAQQKATTEKWRPDIINAINKALAEIDKK